MIPRRALIFNKRMVTILHYHGGGCFFVLDRGRRVMVHRDNLTFLPPSK
jgi:hypothetical protein